MPYQDFRQFLDALRRHGELVDIDRPMHLDSDVPKALKQTYTRQGPAFIFTNNGTEYPLVGGIYATRSKALLAFEATEETIFQKFLSGLDKPVAPVMFSGKAPCQEVVLTGDAIDIRRFPIPTHSPKDGGPYITPSIVVSKDPETGVPDIGHYRFQVVGKDRLSFYALNFHRFGKNIAKCERLGVVLKGAILLEGPRGEFTGYYPPASEKPTVRITAITHRRKPYFQALLTGTPVNENHILKQIPFQASFSRTLY